MKGFKRGFYINSEKLERKAESNLGQLSLSLSQPQLFSQIQQPGDQAGYNEKKKFQKVTHVISPTLEEKPRKQKKSAIHQEVSDFNSSGVMNIEQLIKVDLNLQEEVRKLRKYNEKLMEQLSLAEGIESKLMSQEKELNAF